MIAIIDYRATTLAAIKTALIGYGVPIRKG